MKNILGRLLLALLFASMPGLPCVAQSRAGWSDEPAWLSLERGKRAYENKRFGEALVAFDTAITLRRDSFSIAGEKLAKALDSKEARYANGSIQKTFTAFAEKDFIQRDYAKLESQAGSSVEALIVSLKKERISDEHRNFIDALQLVLEYRSIESLQDSMTTLGYYIKALARYPEAEFWKGKVFFIEGELALADAQYRRALEQSTALDIPEDVYSILYAMADLYEVRADWVAWERVNQRILDGVSAGQGDYGAMSVDAALRSAMSKSLREVGFDRFMTLYRVQPSYALEAYADLASFYLENGRADAMIHAAIAINMSLTRLIGMINIKDKDYTWHGLDDFFVKIQRNITIQDYLVQNPIMRTLLVLADALFLEGGRVHAVRVWKTISEQGTEPFSSIARGRLQKPASAVRRSMP